MSKNIMFYMHKLTLKERQQLVSTFQDAETGKYAKCDIVDLQFVRASVALARLTARINYFKKEYPYRDDYIIPLRRLRVKLGAKVSKYEKRLIRKYEKNNELIPVIFGDDK